MEATMTTKQTKNWKEAYEHAREQIALLNVLREFDKKFDGWARKVQLEQAVALYENGRRSEDIYNIMMG